MDFDIPSRDDRVNKDSLADLDNKASIQSKISSFNQPNAKEFVKKLKESSSLGSSGLGTGTTTFPSSGQDLNKSNLISPKDDEISDENSLIGDEPFGEDIILSEEAVLSSSDNGLDFGDLSADSIDDDEEDDDDDDEVVGNLNIAESLKKKKLMIIGIAVVIVVAVIAISNMGGEELEIQGTITPSNQQATKVGSTINDNTQQTPQKPSGIKIVKIDNLKTDTDLFSDYLIVEKKIVLWGTTTQAVITGRTTKENQEIYFPVNTETYNSYENGQIAEITFNRLKVDGQDYVTNINIGKVVGE